MRTERRQVYICYARADLAIVDSLVRDIERLGFSAWVDQDLVGGELWWDRVLELIRQSDVFLFAISPASLNSQACMLELEYAVAIRRPLLPVSVADVAFALAPASLAEVQWIDYGERTVDAAIQLVRAIGSLPAAPALPSPLPTPPAAPRSAMLRYRELVDADSLTLAEQTRLANELSTSGEDEADAAVELLQALRRRPDLFASVANHIDAMLRDRGRPSPSPSPSPSTIPNPVPATAPPPANSPFTIFISYRREDSEDITGRIRDRLKARFGPAGVFMDIDSIPPGIDFRKHISAAVESCDVVLVVIGRRWLDNAEGDGRARIHEDRDFVRQEIRSALAREIATIPILVQHATPPAETDLPDDIKDLVYRTGLPVRPGADFDTDVARLIDALVHIANTLDKPTPRT